MVQKKKKLFLSTQKYFLYQLLVLNGAHTAIYNKPFLDAANCRIFAMLARFLR